MPRVRELVVFDNEQWYQVVDVLWQVVVPIRLITMSR